MLGTEKVSEIRANSKILIKHAIKRCGIFATTTTTTIVITTTIIIIIMQNCRYKHDFYCSSYFIYNTPTHTHIKHMWLVLNTTTVLRSIKII